MSKQLKLFVWKDVLIDYTDGIMFALAHDIEEAQRVIVRDNPDWMRLDEIYEKQPQIVESAKGFALYGGS